MYKFEYVPLNVWKPIKKELIDIIILVQDKVREYFKFRFDFIGSTQLNMITCDYSQNIGFDFDVNIRVNDPNVNYSAKKIKKILMNAFNEVLSNIKCGYDKCEDNTRVFTIKVKDKKHSKVLHSCDFAIVRDCNDGSQQYIRHNKQQNSYYYEYQPNGFELENKIIWLKRNGYWQAVRDVYLIYKNLNSDPNKKSRSLRAEVINNIYQTLTN